LKKKREIQAAEIPHNNFTDPRTPAELEASVSSNQKAASGFERDARRNKLREGFYFQMWVWSGRLARLGFLFGLLLLLLFAMKNV